MFPHDRFLSSVCPLRSAQFVARVVEDGSVLVVGDVTARLKARRARLKADGDVRDAVHAAECLRDVLDAVRAGHALDVNGLFHDGCFLSVGGRFCRVTGDGCGRCVRRAVAVDGGDSRCGGS